MKGQLSAEMLVVLVVILGAAILLASVMLDSAKKAGEKITERSDALFEKSPCLADSDCASGSCNQGTGECDS